MVSSPLRSEMFSPSYPPDTDAGVPLRQFDSNTGNRHEQGNSGHSTRLDQDPFDESTAQPSTINTWTSVRLTAEPASRAIYPSTNKSRQVLFDEIAAKSQLSGANLDRLNRATGTSEVEEVLESTKFKGQVGWRDSTESLYAPSNRHTMRRGTMIDPLDSREAPPPLPLKLDLSRQAQSNVGGMAYTSHPSGLEFDDSPPGTPPIPTTTLRKAVIQPSLALLFSLTPKSTKISIVLPGVIFAVICGLIPPYMTEILGSAFGAFTTYTIATANPNISPEALDAAKAALLRSARFVSFRFLGLAALIMVTTGISVTLWVLNGEQTVKLLRQKVFAGVGARDMEWYDLGMGTQSTEGDDGEASDAAQGAGGLMGRFSRDTDNVRVAGSQSMGLLIQYSVSFLFCLILSFYRNWLLTFVILASIPLITLIVGITESMAAKLIEKDTEYNTLSASRVDRILGAITTVKAFNAETLELNGFAAIAQKSFDAYNKVNFVYGFRQGATQFLLLSMFVQGFWFGSYLCTSGRSTSSAVSTCFWACLLASTYLQSCVPILVSLEKGKIAMAGLLELSDSGPDESPLLAARPTSTFEISKDEKRKSGAGVSKHGRKARKGSSEAVEPFALQGQGLNPTTADPFADSARPADPSKSRGRVPAARALRKLRPATFSGEISFKNVSFHYPSRPYPAPPALLNVSLYLAAQETTYIVGTSGSGKSTVGSLLLGLYRPEAGTIEIDEQGSDWIDQEWLRGHVACVSQGASVLFDGTIHDNVAIGVVGQLRPDGTTRSAQDVTREEVVNACRGALMHEFIRDLPDGYDTWLSGEKGASLSGGQRQRLAIARAWIRDPTVLILDEATSALDATSRLLVSEAVKSWRKNKTTIIITHDLTPINSEDFVYVMTEGQVVEQGYREDLEDHVGGPFYNLTHSQHSTGDGDDKNSLDFDSEEEEEEEIIFHEKASFATRRATRASFVGGGLFPAPSHDLARAGQAFFSARHASQAFVLAQTRRASGERRPSYFSPTQAYLGRRPSNFAPIRPDMMPRVPRRSIAPPPSFAPPVYDYSRFTNQERRDSSKSFKALNLAASSAMNRRGPGGNRMKHKTMVFDSDAVAKSIAGKKGDDTTVAIDINGPADKPYVTMTLGQLFRRVYPEIPNKPLFFAGLSLSLGVGACTPIFSSLLSKLMTNLGNPTGNSIVVRSSLLILLMAFLESAATFAKYYLLERCAMGWIVALRKRGLDLVVRQDKAWFDAPENSLTSLTHALVKDSEDARALVGSVVGQLLVVFSMIFIGLTWAACVGWELTLIGVGLAPVFVFATKYQADIQSTVEAKNKVMREDVSKRFYQTVSNVRAIRSMSIQSVFTERFEVATNAAYQGGAKAAPLAGVGLALGSSLTYIAEALMFYVGALLVISGKYTFGRMVEVFTLIIFSITFSAQIMTFLPGMTKAIRATIDLARLMDLTTETAEAEGRMTFPIRGHVTFDNVEFAYPQRPDIPILKGMSFEVKPGECVGIVGASGSGKSTITSLVQRLYEPSSGSVLLDGRPLSRVDVHYLRDHIAIVSQHPALFDMTIYQNIGYGCIEVTEGEIIGAAKAAHVHDFIMSLPKGYQTMLGENASLISGGQAQRLQIARALVRPRELLILDECTSALDAENQAAVMETIMSVKHGKTTMIVTHKLAVMEMCDRLIVLDAGGHVAETGTCAELRAKPGGLFAQLATGGEWESS